MSTPWDAIMGQMNRISDRLDTAPTLREATVHGSSPVSVLFDTDSSPTTVTGSLADVSAGDRVLTARIRHYVWILGVKGGSGGSGYRLLQVVRFTAGGVFTKASYPDIRAIRVRAVGGGGGGGGAAPSPTSGTQSFGQGGGGGGYAESLITDIAALPSSVAITVGAGGTGAPPGGSLGGGGGASSFGTLVAAGGGGGGSTKPASQFGPYVPPGPGGTATAGDFRASGGGGSPGAGDHFGLAMGGTGGPSLLGGGGVGGATGAGGGNMNGAAGGNYGGGGGGGMANAGNTGGASGGNGAPGIVIVEVYA